MATEKEIWDFVDEFECVRCSKHGCDDAAMHQVSLIKKWLGQ